MRRLLAFMAIVVAFVLTMFTAQEASAQAITILYGKKAIATATNRTDTSATFPLKDYPWVELATSVEGTDSAIIKSYVDYYIPPKWVLAGVSDTLKCGLLMTGGGVKAKGVVLRSATTNSLPGATHGRVRNVITPFLTTDSVSTTRYNQYIIQRKTQP